MTRAVTRPKSSAAVQTFGLTKWYGRSRGVEDLDLEVRRGEVLGLLGPNGAGKTTTIRLLLDLIRPTAGRAEVFGLEVRRNSLQVRRRVGYLPGELAFPLRLTGLQVLAYLGELRGGVDPRCGDELAERLELDLDRRIGDLSKGNRQKLAVVQAFQHRPELYVLDEPTSGLDPLVQHTFHDLVEEVVARGATVLLSSHVLSEVQHMADRVAMVRAGRVAAIEGIDDLRASALRRVEVRFAQPVSAAEFAHLPGVESATVEETLLRCELVGDADALVKAIARHHVLAITSEEPDVEEMFLRLYADDGGTRA
jgi:ABC-2 type transport system ATP-binding protein